MPKKTVSMKMSLDLLNFLDQTSEALGTSRSKTIELFIDIIQDYFTQDQLWAECNARGDRDGRKKLGK